MTDFLTGLTSRQPGQVSSVVGQSDIMRAQALGMRANTESRMMVNLFERYFLALRNHWIWAVGMVVSALLIGVLATLLATPQYTANTRIQVLPNAPVDTEVDDRRSQSWINEQSFYNTQYALLESESLAERVARAGNLATDDAFLKAFGFAEEEGTQPNSASRQVKLKRISSALLGRVAVGPLRTSSLVDVSFTSADPAVSAKIANLWAEQYIQATLDRRFAATSDARKFLDQRIEVIRKAMEDSERALVNYASANDIILLSTERDQNGRTRIDRTLVSADIEKLTGALADARADRISAQSQLGATMSGAAAINAATIGSLRQKRAEVAAELARVEAVFGDEYPPLVALRSQLANLDRSINAETSRSSQSAREAFASAQQREQKLQAEVDRLTGRYSDQQRRSIQYAILQREVDTNRELYDGLLQRYKEIGTAGVGTNNISIVDPAAVPTAPSSPQLILNLALALLVGLGLSALLVFLLEQLDQSIRDPADVSKQLGLPLLGAIPGVVNDSPLVFMQDKKSELYESYVSLHTNLSFLTDHGAPRSLMITSSRPAEGKSSSAISLAIVSAASRRRTILIDADIRSPSVNEYLELPNDRGLSYYLAGEENLDSLIIPSGIDGLSLMLAGPMPPNAAELLSGERFDKLIRRLLESYDQVIVDSPPVLGLADAPLLSRKVEGVLFVIEANVGKVRGIRSALDRLELSGGKLFGAVVTKLDSRNQAYGYSYGYGYGYGSNKLGERSPSSAD